ncbi:MAG: toll/interleukin-1 receptor domain-containing protein [Myxococcales bacterium]|nr:toll/interleukin-1 receptor domain-containing protein [Myxococcales bacterium]
MPVVEESVAAMNTGSRPGSVFISYKREEAAKAAPLREALVEEGFNVWWDEDLQCGQAWAEELDQAVQDAACIIVLWSERSVASQWVRHEASQAIARRVYAPCRIYVREHNTRMLHHAFAGQTPDEVYFDQADGVRDRLTAARHQARRARMEANRGESCRACAPPAQQSVSIIHAVANAPP